MSNSISLREAREIVMRERGGGVICPCCDKYVKVYSRSFNASMARSLIWLVNASKSGSLWIDVPMQAPQWLVRTNQLSLARWWGLVERFPSQSGMWRPSKDGVKFAQCLTRIPSNVLTYNGDFLEYEGSLISITDALGKHFDYDELMKPSSLGDAKKEFDSLSE